MPHLSPLMLRDVQRSFADRAVLRGVSLTVPPGARIGLIGQNGVGKSTLLRIAAGLDEADAGEVAGPERIGLLEQEPPYTPGMTVSQLLQERLAEIHVLTARLDAAAAALATISAGGIGAPEDATEVQAAADDAATAYAEALEAAEQAEVWTLEHRTETVLAGLGLAGLDRERALETLSGGQRARVFLAALLLSKPAALLLDEPTNHLDDAAVDFLCSLIGGWHGPVLFASHDRDFLDRMATGLVDLDEHRGAAATVFGGNYSDWLAEKARARQRWEDEHRAQQEELAELAHAVAVTSRRVAHGRARSDNEKMGYDYKGGRADAQVSRRVRNAKGRLAELEATQLRKPPALLRFQGIPRGSHAVTAEQGPLVQAEGLAIPGRLRLERIAIETEHRLLVTGANGAGKSTLLNLLAGVLPLPAGRGTLLRRKGLRVGLLAQVLHWPDAEQSPRAIYRQLLGERRAEQQSLVGLGLIAPRDLDRPVGALSIGQQRRLALALVIAKPPQLFLLDEPGNHLSLDLVTELEDALGEYPGAVVIASHDRWLRRRWRGERLELQPW